MPEYLHPGVYVEEIDAGPKPIEGVSTSTAGAVGVTMRGPTSGKPELVTSFADFTRLFGGFMSEPTSALVNQWALDPNEGGRWWNFPLSVKGFFDNGGQRLYVKRVFSASAVAASAGMTQGFIAEITADAATGAKTLKVSHLINLFVGGQIQIRRGDTGAQIGGNFNVRAYLPSGSITLDTALPAAVQASRGDFVQIHPVVLPLAAATTALSFTAKARGAWGNSMKVEVRPMVGQVFAVQADPAIANNAAFSTTVAAVTVAAGPPVVWTITAADVAGLANGDHVVIGGLEYPIANLVAAAKTFDVSPAAGANPPAVGSAIRRLRKADNAGVNTLHIWNASALYTGAIVELDNGTDKETFTVNSTNADTVTLSGNLTKVYFEGHKLRTVEVDVSLGYDAGDGAPASEDWPNLNFVSGSASNLITVINNNSALATVAAGAGFSATDLTKFPVATAGGWQPFTSGDDQLASLTVDDFVGVDGGSGNRTGIQAMEDIDEISICMVPNVWSATVRSALIQHCELLRYRFAIIDPQDGLSIEGIRTVRSVLDSKYAALYYPWIEVRDPAAKRNVVVAPSAHMAGIYARVDVERGVHKAPANEVVRGITKIAQDVTQREQDMLNPNGINALRAFTDRGSRVWGARTISSDSAWKYVNVRRLFIYVEASIDRATQWVVFEPNDENTWARVRQSISNFLISTWRNGALFGTTQDEAFFVKCDRTTMTPDDITNGRLICVVGIAPVYPAEFVIFRIQQKTLEAKS
jgi:uncharacterized protein